MAPPQIAAMIQLQRLTGMRPDEATIMRPCDIDRTDEIWLYVPQGHKMEWRDIETSSHSALMLRRVGVDLVASGYLLAAVNS